VKFFYQLTKLLVFVSLCIDQEFVTSAKKFANFNEFSEIKKIRKNSLKKSLNARVGVAFQQQLKNLMRFTVSC